MDTFLNEMLSLSLLELIAALLALAYVLLAAKQNIWCWLCAFVSSGIYVSIFWRAELPYQAALNFFYVAMAVYGWSSWNRIQNDSAQIQVKSLAPVWHLLAIAVLGSICLLLTSLPSNGEANSGQSALIHYLDVGIAVFSVFTTYLVVQKYLDNWVYWIVLNSAAAYLYASQSLYFTTVLFCVYVLMSLYGLFSWRESGTKREPVSVS